jgi:N-acetylglucosaminyldiphosphoundecaprenol N-acetyl-beta-D-mannosaminyltransferase
LPERLDFLGAPLDPLTLEEAVAVVHRLIQRGETGQQASLNAAKVVRARRDAELARALWSCDLVLADGQSIVWAGKVLGRRIPERVPGIDLMTALCARAAERGYRVFLVGARPDVIDDAAGEIERRHPGIQIVGKHHGYYSDDEEAAVIRQIEGARPHLLFVAFETPQKELFLSRVRGVIRVPFAMGVGGSFDVLAGRRRRAPVWMQTAGLEWSFRFVQEPRRLARRYLVGNALFVALVLREVVQSRLRPGIRPGASS